MQKVSIHGIRFFGRGFDRDLVLLAVSDQFRPARKLLPEIIHLPRRHDRQVRSKSHVGQLETTLIVTLTRSAVGNRIRIFFARDIDVGFGDQRTSNGRAEVILPFVNRIGANHRVDIVAGEFLDQIERVVLRGPRLTGLGTQSRELLLLPHIGGIGNNFGSIGFLEPLDDDGGV